MKSDTPWSTAVSNQRVNTLASLNLGNIDVMVHMCGCQESPRESNVDIVKKHVAGIQILPVLDNKN